MVGSNIGKARLFNNDGILEGTSNIGHAVFGQARFERLGERAKGVRIEKLVIGERLKDKVDIEVELGERINLAEYFSIRTLCHQPGYPYSPIPFLQ